MLALAAVLISIAVVQQGEIRELREQNEVLQTNRKEPEHVESQDSQQLRLQAAEIERLREETKDLLRLRNEVRQLHEQLRELEVLRVANAQLLQAAQGTANMPTNQAALISAARKQGAILGIHLRPVTDTQTDPGAFVVGIDANSPVAESGIKAGDVIIGLDGRRIETSGQLQAEMLTRKPGETVVLDVVRGGTTLRFQVKTRGWPE
jgi:C-terminal processing protease CtpA/Prc